MSVLILLKLLLAHVVADFFLQTDRLCRMKNDGRKKWTALSLHCAIHAALAYLLVGQWKNWIIPVVIFATHFLTDWLKTSVMKDGIRTFLADQAINLVVIIALWLGLVQDVSMHNVPLMSVFSCQESWAAIIVYALMLKPSSVFLNLLLKRWEVDIKDKSLPNAGKWIGYLERMLILTFILTGNIEGVGFLLAAKSIFRFGDLTNAKDIKVTEYVMIGTLASFTIAILSGFLLKLWM